MNTILGDLSNTVHEYEIQGSTPQKEVEFDNVYDYKPMNGSSRNKR